jgi:hypothetical protein
LLVLLASGVGKISSSLPHQRLDHGFAHLEAHPEVVGALMAIVEYICADFFGQLGGRGAEAAEGDNTCEAAERSVVVIDALQQR